MSVESFIKEHISMVGGKAHIAPDIPAKKLDGAISAMAPGQNPDYVVAIVDTTLFGSGKEGALFTGEYLYLHSLSGPAQKYQLREISGADYQVSQVKNGDKVQTIEHVSLCFKNGSATDITSILSGMSLKGFTNFINEMAESANSEDFVSTSQVRPLSAMSPEIKKAYVKVLCNFSLANDSLIDSTEYAEIVSLMSRIEMDKDSRIEMRTYMISSDCTEDLSTLLDFLKEKIDDGVFEIAMQSLMKDCLFLHRKTDSTHEWSANPFLKDLQGKIDLSDAQVNTILEAIINDENILSQRKSDSEIQKAIKDTAAKAAAVGVPLTAIYFSGTMGLSAAGLTSALAHLGLGGLLGFSPMVTGIGVAVLMGVGAYQGVKKVTGLKDLENNKQRELLLQEIIKNSQRSLDYLIEDVNEIAALLQKAIEKENQDEIKFQKLSAILTMLSKGAQGTSNQIQYAEKEKLLAKLPLSLRQTDRNRIIELTEGATKQKIRTLILNAYNEETELDENNVSNTMYVLNDTLPITELESIYHALDGIGYFKVTDAAMASVKSAAKGFLSNLTK